MHASQWTRRPLTGVISGLVFVLGNSPINAQTVSNWTDPTGGAFSDASNWDAGVPGQDDVAVIALPGSAFTIDFGNSILNDRLIIRNGDVTLNLGGNTYELLNPMWDFFAVDVSLHVGKDAGENASLKLLDGDLWSAQAHIADGAGSKGLLEVGAGAVWYSQGNIHIGRGGEGAVVIRDGGRVEAFGAGLGIEAGAEGTLTITGPTVTAQPSWNGSLTVGVEGQGAVTVEHGAQANATLTHLGVFAGSKGTVDITGTDGMGGASRLDMAYTFIGDKGEGHLNISDGAEASTLVDAFLASRTGSQGSATVSGAGSSWTVGGALFVGGKPEGFATQDDELGGTFGEYGDASLTVSNGGVVTVGTLVASRDDLKGDGIIQAGGVLLDGYDVVFDSPGSLQQVLTFGTGDQGQLQLDVSGTTQLLGAGHKGTGSITITNGQVLESVEGVLGHLNGSHGTGTVSGAGSAWNVQEYLRVGRFGSGTLDVTDGATVSSLFAVLGQHVGASGTVTVGAGSQWTNTEALRVGEWGTGSLTVESGGVVDTRVLLASINDLHGGGTIHARGAILDDIHLQFDSTHGLQQTLAFGSGGELHLDLTAGGNGGLGVGYRGEGTMTISEGRKVVTDGLPGYGGTGTGGVIGFMPGSNGSATVTGVDAEGNPSTWESIYGIHVGVRGTGSLTVSDGALVDAGVSFIGGAEGASGTVTVIGTDRAGAPTTWRSYGGLLVGADLGEGFGEGRIDVLSGGYALAGVDFNSPVLPTVTFGPKGQVNVSGSIEDVEGVLKPSTFWAGGVLQMSGDMTVSDGGLFVTQGLSELGNTPDDPSVATIRGSDSAGNASTWAALGGMLIGRFGTAELHIEDGAHVMTGSGAIGSFHSDADWDAVVNVAGSNGNGVPSRWEMSGILYAGGTPFGSTGVTGTLNITDGGRVSSSEGLIGVGGTALGTVSVRGHDGHGLTSTWDVGGRLRVGVESTGQLAILDGGIVNSASGYVGELNGSSGLVTVSGAGSTWTVTNHLVLGGSGLSNSTTGNGVLTVRDGGLVDVGGTLKIFPGSTLNGNGTVRGYIENAGLIAPGNSAGTLTLEGNVLSYPSSMLSIELGGTGAGQFDVLNVLGSFHAYGELSVSLIDGFHPNGTESFTILTAYTLTGYFTNAVPAFGDIAASVTFGDLTFDVVYDYANGSILLTNVVPEPATLGLMVAALGLIRRRNRRVAA